MLRLQEGVIFVAFALLLSLGLGFAYFSQYYLSVDTCAMCYTQRYLFMGAIFTLLVTAVFFDTSSILKYLSLLALAANLVFSGFHVGVEQKWWKGPSTCTSNTQLDLKNASPEQALEQLKLQLSEKKFVPCDKVGWRIFGIPATMLNTLFLLMLFIITLKVIITCHKRSSQIFYKK